MEMDQETLRRLLDYDPETGALTWKERPVEMFTTPRAAKLWNAKHAGRPAMAGLSDEGYPHGGVMGRVMKAHRVIWCLVYGSWPEQVDHINGIKNDNRLANLREVSASGNAQNRPRRRDNKSGIVGVTWQESIGKWKAEIRVSGALHYLGIYVDIADAASARERAERKFGFHENHGRVA